MLRTETLEKPRGLRERLVRLDVETVADSINRRNNLIEDRRLNENLINSFGQRLSAITNRRERRLYSSMIKAGEGITDRIDRELDQWPRLSRGIVLFDNDSLRIPLPEAKRRRR